MNLLLDTNVLIAAFVSHGACADLLVHCLRRHTMVTSRYILDEFRKVLTTKFAISQRQARTAADLLRDHMIVVEPDTVPPNACDDPADLPVLGTAVSGKCLCIVTGDKALQSLGRYKDIDIVSPAAFWKYDKKTSE